MHFIKSSTYPDITFETLFPRNLRSKLNWTQTDFLKLLPKEFLALEDGNSIPLTSKARISKYWNASDPDSHADAQRVKFNILNLASSGNYSFSTLNGIKNLKTNLESFLQKMPKDIREQYEEDIIELINNHFLSGIKESEPLYDGFKEYNMKNIFNESLKELPSKLTCLTLIAATWFFWKRSAKELLDEEEKNSLQGLALIIFPDCSNNFVPSNDKNIDELCKKEKTKASKDLDHAKTLFYNSHDYRGCGEICEKIISMGFVDPLDRGLAYYLLVKCHEDFGYTNKDYHYYDAKQFIRRAVSLGCVEAREEWKTLHLDSLVYCPKPSNDEPSYLVFNSPKNNRYVLSYLKTIPKEMLNEEAFKRYITFTDSEGPLESKSKLVETISPKKKIRYLFLDDNFDKNFHDMIYLLDRMKNWSSNSSMSSQDYKVIDWSKVEIYLRTNESLYSPLIDTAIKHMNGIFVSIFTIDDARWNAQYLFSHHPLFYPIRSISKKHLQETPYTININILSINDDLVNSLIKEAFWMSCFIYKSLTIQINIFSTEAELIEKRLRYECRGLWGTIPDSKYTSSIKINTIDSLKNGFHSSDLIYVLDKHCLNSQFNYFILNIGDDISNLNLGIKIREWSIEKAIKAKSHVDKIELPIITYYCEDPDISHLAESMVVQLEAHGDSWYNNYSLIPFGMLTNRYSYDNLSGGYFERVSQSTHLQYCGVAPRDSESRQEALEEYYSRFYNRDSSMAVARSLPYRLFQTSTCSGLDHIIPVGWNITNANAFTNAVSIDDMANDFNSRNNTDELILYEHARWARWMISRGWSSASPDETIQYMDAGNLKQQLYIGRLHPCICDFSELDHLSNIMYDHYLEKGDTRFVDTPFKKKDFTKFDKSNIEQTADIIKTIWFTRQNDMDREL